MLVLGEKARDVAEAVGLTKDGVSQAADQAYAVVEAWLLRHPSMGPLIRNWRERRVVPLRAKQLAWGGMAISCTVSALVLPFPLGFIPALACTIVAFYLYRLPSA